MRSLRATELLQLDRPVGVVEERLPRVVFLAGQLQVEQRAAFWLFRLADQAHVRLFRRAAALAHIAVDAGADDVLPAADAALAARNNVVQAQVGGRKTLAAELALVVVACE